MQQWIRPLGFNGDSGKQTPLQQPPGLNYQPEPTPQTAPLPQNPDPISTPHNHPTHVMCFHDH